MKSKIAEAFDNCKKEKRSALITYVVAGDNSKKNSIKILNAISQHADIIELGFPHNTPIADGGQIQESSHRALKKGIELADVFQIVKKFKKKNQKKPLILMGYYNLIYQSGENSFLNKCKKTGVDGIIVVDCKIETAVSRLVQQRGFDEKDARARIAKQATPKQRREFADFLIDNNGPEENLSKQIEKCWEWVHSLSAKKRNV